MTQLSIDRNIVDALTKSAYAQYTARVSLDRLPSKLIEHVSGILMQRGIPENVAHYRPWILQTLQRLILVDVLGEAALQPLWWVLAIHRTKDGLMDAHFSYMLRCEYEDQAIAAVKPLVARNVIAPEEWAYSAQIIEIGDTPIAIDYQKVDADDSRPSESNSPGTTADGQ